MKVNINFFFRAYKQFYFIEITDNGDSKEDIVTNIAQSLEELKLYKTGKIEFRDANELISEL